MGEFLEVNASHQRRRQRLWSLDVESVRSSGIKLSATVTSLTQEQSKNMSWIRDLAASLSLDWNIKTRGGRARWKSRYGWLWVWSWRTNGIQLLSKAIRTWLDCVLICNFSGWSFITGMDVSWELFWYICWYCVLNPRCEPSLQLKYLHIATHSFDWSDQTRCFLFNFCPAHSLRGNCHWRWFGLEKQPSTPP